ncbi:hypothetical protein OEZ86_006190 [Tetradesmus obliquus]|nr:hypothetical protein OEZ86_006190 [Tetradesmus obliquus]
MCNSTGSSGNLPLAMQSFVVEAPVQCREHTGGQQEWDVLGVGQAMVDFAASVDEGMLQSLNVPKGGRRVISVPERAEVMQLLDGCDSQVSAGGSLANTLVGLGQLTAAQERSDSSSSTPASTASTDSVRVGMTGCVGGSDALGEFARAQLQAAGVDVVGPGPTSNATGVVMVFTTPDAQRSFLSSFSSEDSLHMSQQLQDAAASARLLLIEGYMWETEGAAEAIPALVRHARSVGTLVALTAGDAGVVERHGAKVLQAIAAGVDIWFGNEAEAAALVQHLHAQQAEQQQARAALEQQQQDAVAADLLEDEEQDFTAMQLERLGSSAANNKAAGIGGSSASSSASSPASHSSSSNGMQQPSGMDAALQLASACPMVVVTDGSKGSYITAMGQLVVVPPYWSTKPPVDTCGAGDAYAAGLLYGFLCGLDLHSMGHLAAKTASAVIAKHGPQLSPEDAEWVVAGLRRPSRAGVAAAAATASSADAS